MKMEKKTRKDKTTGKRGIFPVIFYLVSCVFYLASCEQPAGSSPEVSAENPTTAPELTTGTLRFAVTVPGGVVLAPAESFIRIEQNGAAPGSLNSNGFSGGVLMVSNSVAEELTLEQGDYEVSVTLCRIDGYITDRWEKVELAAGEAREIDFSPALTDFLDPAAQVAKAGGFEKTAVNSSGIRMDSGGGKLKPTQLLTAVHDKTAVYFSYLKSRASGDSQTLAVGGRDAAMVTKTENGTVDGSTTSARRVLFTVDTQDIAASGGERVFTLRLDELGALGIQYTVTVVIPHCVKLQIDEGYPILDIDGYPDKRNYGVGDTFNPDGLLLTAYWSDGSSGAVSLDPAVGNWEPEGFDTSSTGEQTVFIIKNTIAPGANGKITAHEYDGNGAEKPGTGGFAISVRPGRLSFDRGYGDMSAAIGAKNPPSLKKDPRSAIEYPYTLTAGKTLVLAPIKWYIADSAVYEWQVDGVAQSSATEYLSYTTSVLGDHRVTVSAKLNGTVLATAEAKVQCTGGAVLRPKTAASLAQSPKFFSVTAPGQFGSNSSRLGNFHGFGGFGGHAVFVFDHSVLKKGTDGEELRIGGNAFSGWEEPGIIWVSRDENNNGMPDDTWYELKGSHTLVPSTVRRYAVTYYKQGLVYEDNQGVSGRFDNYSGGDRESITLTGTRITANYNFWGYADVGDNGLQSLSNAIQVDGTPVDLPFIDYLMIVTGQHMPISIVGEHSTEANTPSDRSVSDPDFIITGISQGNGQYKYTFENQSGYDLTITFCGETFELKKDGGSASRTVNEPKASIDFYGGNVTLKRFEGGAKFISG
ncbi:MAG: bacterial Ig-like domain-containing protein [Spirochaetaceae bacterium]|nr:bacterial Ig-like domain-containing protein [Spirochaetaceae bacterium]